jgi:N-methylhydantoinase B
MQDLVSMALASAIPEKVMAGTCRGAQNILTVASKDAETGEEWGVILFNGSGGSGATAQNDGWPVFESLAAFGGMTNAPIEELEVLYPLRITHWEVECDSMGMGAQLGGPGVRLVVEPVGTYLECDTLGDGMRNPPHGVCGGGPGFGGGQFVERLEDGHRRFISATGHFFVREGEVWCGVTSGGGGYGNPLDRPLERVRADTRDGFISPEAARNQFGVVFKSLEPDFEVDEDMTTRQRGRLRQEVRDGIQPTVPNSGAWAEANARPGDERLLNPRETQP